MQSAIVAGGGIGGMAAALALARAGWRVTVCEQAEEITEVGAGLQVSPNASRALRALGVLDAVAEVASRPERAILRDGRTGSTIFTTELGESAVRRWGSPYLHVHRADLLAALSRAAENAGAEVMLGARVRHALDTRDGVAVHLENETRLEADLVIGADGIRSALRRQLNEDEQPRFAGQVAWRGTVPAERLPAGTVRPEATVWAGPKRHLVTYPLRRGALINFVAVEERPEGLSEGWVAPGDPDMLRRAYAGWHPQVEGLLAQVESTFQWGLYDRPEQVTWVKGRIVLIGDAAHPMLPFMAQGAAMALEDAVVLDRCLAAGNVAEALRAFEDIRWRRVTRVQARARANGRLFHKRTLLGRLTSHLPLAALTRALPGLAAGQLDWLYGYDPTI